MISTSPTQHKTFVVYRNKIRNVSRELWHCWLGNDLLQWTQSAHRWSICSVW